MPLVAIVPIISVTLSLLSISEITFTSRSMSDVTPLETKLVPAKVAVVRGKPKHFPVMHMSVHQGLQFRYLTPLALVGSVRPTPSFYENYPQKFIGCRYAILGSHSSLYIHRSAIYAADQWDTWTDTTCLLWLWVRTITGLIMSISTLVILIIRVWVLFGKGEWPLMIRPLIVQPFPHSSMDLNSSGLRAARAVRGHISKFHDVSIPNF